jgi:hypothetical protein
MAGLNKEGIRTKNLLEEKAFPESMRYLQKRLIGSNVIPFADDCDCGNASDYARWRHIFFLSQTVTAESNEGSLNES